jgi:hypothetical protein
MKPGPQRGITLHILIVADADATVAVAETDGMTLTASAKREPGDRPDLAIGRDLAAARVLAKAARRLERRARGAVKHADDVKTARREAREGKAREQFLRDLTDPDRAKGAVRHVTG